MRRERQNEISDSIPVWVQRSIAQSISVTVSLVMLAAGVDRRDAIEYVETLLSQQLLYKEE